MTRYVLLLLLLSLIAVALPDADKAVASMRNAQGDNIGEVSLTQTPEGVLLQVQLENVEPGVHALHIHETGKCEGPDFKSAGGHFNPEHVSHGYLKGADSHAGDMPNFTASSDGKVMVEIMNPDVVFQTGKPNSLLGESGTAIVIHSGADDYKSQPSGDAGNRIACGVITPTT